MLSSSPPKIHNPLVTGVSPRPTDRRQRQELRNTRGRVAEPRRRPLHLVDGGIPRADPVGARSACSGLGQAMLGVLTPFGEASLVQVHLVPPLPTGEITMARRL